MGIIVVLFILAIFGWNLGNCKMNWSEGFREPAIYIKDNWQGSALLIDINNDANLIFHLRAIDPNRRLRIYMSVKIFASTMVFKKWGVKSFIKDERQLLDSLAKYGIRYILLEKEMPSITNVESLLREVVETEKFQKIREFLVYLPGYQLKILSLYRYKEKISQTPTIPTIYLPIVGLEIPSKP